MSSSQRLVGTYLLGFEPMLVSVVDDEVLGSVHEDRPRFNPDMERTLGREPEGTAIMGVRGPEGYLQMYEASLLESEIHLEG